MVGQTVGKYRVVSRLGRGGMGTVYKAVDETLEREVAIKCLNPGLAEPDVLKRFRAEAITLARLNHPSIATLFELTEHAGDLLMVMEFVRGETFDKVSARFGAMPVDRAARLCAQVLDALAYAHRAGVVHRDLKPANLMLTDSGLAKVMDFGIARMAGTEHLTLEGYMMGTPAYMAPEQVLGGDIDGRTDLYSMGVVFYRLLTAQLPFKADSGIAMVHKQIHDLPTPVRQFRADLPAACQEILTRAMAKGPGDRYQTAEEFRDALAALAGVGAADVTATRAMSVMIHAPDLDPTMPPMPTPIFLAQPEMARSITADPPPDQLPTVQTPMAQPTTAPPNVPPPPAVIPLPVGPPPAAPKPVVVAPKPVPPAPKPVPAASTSVPAAPKPVVAAPKPVAAVPKPAPSSPASGARRVPAAAAGLLLLAGVATLAFVVWRANGRAPESETARSAGDSAAAAPAITPPVGPAAVNTAPAPTAGAPIVEPRSPAATQIAAPRPKAAARISAPPPKPAATASTSEAAPPPDPRPSPPGPETPSGPALPIVTFPNLKLLVSSDGKVNDRDAALHLGSDGLRVVDGAQTLHTAAYQEIIGLFHSHSREPRWATPSGVSAPVAKAGGKFSFLKGTPDWVTVRTKNVFIPLRVPDDDLARVIGALEARTGTKIVRTR